LKPAGGTALGAACGLRLHLRSGTRLPLPGAPEAWPPLTARDAVLAALAGHACSERALADVAEPALRAFHSDVVAEAPAVDLVAVGACADRPRVSIVIPLTERADVLRCRAGRFAIDAALDAADVIYVVANPLLWPAVEADLHDIVRGFGQRARIALCAQPTTRALALNAAAAAARAPVLVFLGASVVPQEKGWLDVLTAPLASALPDGRRIGLVGGRLLDESHRLRHAGADVTRGEWGESIVRHRCTGFPRDHSDAAGDGPVPVASSACLAVDRACFAAAGGFGIEYLTQAFAGAELCFRMRQRGLAVWHLARPAMLDFGATGDARAGVGRRDEDGRRELARIVDGRHFHRRWPGSCGAEPPGAGAQDAGHFDQAAAAR
jgi:hypothetical protein